MRERGNPILHVLDRYAGIPAVAALGALRRKRAIPTKIQTIGLLKTGAIGDTVLMSGIVADLHNAYPEAALVLFTGRSNLEIAQMIEGLDRVTEVPVKHPFAGIRAIRSLPVDVLLDFGQWSRLESIFANCARAGCTIGFCTTGQHRHYGYDIAVEHSNQIHELENFRRLVHPLGVRTSHVPQIPQPHKKAGLAGDYAAFHLWSAGRRREQKQWPMERWLCLAEDFARWGLRIVLTGSASDCQRNERFISAANESLHDPLHNAAGVSLEETCAILAGARLVVSVDTGVIHLAASLGAPLVSLHGPTSSRRWGPIGPNVLPIDSPLAGSGYLNLGWEHPKQPLHCMEAISYESVRDACRSILESQTLQVRPHRSQEAAGHEPTLDAI